MKSNFSRVLSLVLAILTVFSIGSTSFAINSEEKEYIEITEYDALPADEELQEEEIIVEPIVVESPVVIMYLCATARTLTGHVWLYFDNIGTETVTVGYVELEPGKQMSVGSLRNTRTDGGGTYYNGEAYMAKDLEKTGRHTTYLQMELTLEQLEIVSNQIKSRNSYNLILNNCGNFAVSVWNKVSSHKIVHITFPFITIIELALHGGKKGLVMARPLIEECFKQVKDGVVQATASSFNSSCV